MKRLCQIAITPVQAAKTAAAYEHHKKDLEDVSNTTANAGVAVNRPRHRRERFYLYHKDEDSQGNAHFGLLLSSVAS
jgi:hypothetical protein